MLFRSGIGEEVLRVGSNELAFPVTDADGNEDFIVLVVKIPTGANKGTEPYDGYAMAEDYELKVRAKEEKAKKAAEEKAKKIAKDEKRSSTLNKDQKENLVHKEHILEFLKDKDDYIVASVIAENCNISPHKVSALCVQLRESNLIVAEKVKQEGKKGKAFGYKLVEQTDEE